MDGVEATKRLRQAWPAIAVVGLLVHNSPDVERAMRDAGAAAFHTKEAAVEQLYHTIQQVL